MKSDINFSYLIFLSVVAALGGFLFGYDAAVISGTISQVTTQFQLDQIQTGCQQNVDGEGADHSGVIAALIAAPDDDQGRQNHQHHQPEQVTVPKTRGIHQLRPPSDRPKKPLGQNNSTRMSTTNTKASR